MYILVLIIFLTMLIELHLDIIVQHLLLDVPFMFRVY